MTETVFTIWIASSVSAICYGGGVRVDCVITDPPYLINYQTHRRQDKDHKFCKAIQNDDNPQLIIDLVPLLYDVMKDNTPLYMFCGSDKVDFFKQEVEKCFTVKNLEKDDTFYPTCRFCGKQTLPDAPYLSQDEANEAATIRCDCFEAREYQEKLRKEKERADNIIKLRQRLDDFSEYSASRGVELTGELHDLLLNVGIAIIDGQILKANINVGRIKVSISSNSKSVLTICFTYSDGAKLEV